MKNDVPLNPRTTPLGVLLVAGLPTAQAIEAVGGLDTPSVIDQAIRAEMRCQARSAVIDALKARLTVRRIREQNNVEARRRNAQRSTHNATNEARETRAGGDTCNG